MKKKQKDRRLQAANLAQKEAVGDYSHLKNKKGELITRPLPQPTLPKVSVDDDDSLPPPSASTHSYSRDYFYSADKSADIPPMPLYNPYSRHPAPGAPTFHPPFDHEDQYSYSSPRPYDDDADSTTKLGPSSLSFARDPVDRQGSPYYPPNKIDPVNIYKGRAPYSPAPSQTHYPMSPAEHERQPSSGSSVALPYDDGYSTDHRTQPTLPHSTYVNSSRGGRGYDEETARGNYQGGYAA
jgi:hypothetical protein